MFTILLSTDRKLSIQSFLVYNAMQEQRDERFICFVRIPMVFFNGGHTYNVYALQSIDEIGKAGI